jgi:hypothetical protein
MHAVQIEDAAAHIIVAQCPSLRHPRCCERSVINRFYRHVLVLSCPCFHCVLEDEEQHYCPCYHCWAGVDNELGGSTPLATCELS